MPSAIYAKGRKIGFNVECHYDEYHYAEWHYAECHSAPEKCFSQEGSGILVNIRIGC